MINTDKDGKLWLKTYHADLRRKDQATIKIPDESVDVIVTSPPYKKKDGYSGELMQELGLLAGRVLKPGGRFFLNFGQLREGLSRPFDARLVVETWSGLENGQTIVWVKSIVVPSWREPVSELLEDFKLALKGCKSAGDAVKLLKYAIECVKGVVASEGRPTQRGHFQPVNSPKLLNYCWEPVFQFFKPPEPDLDRLSVGVSFTDKSNMKRGTRGKHGDLHCAGDAWFIPYSTTGHTKKKAHGYEYPEALVERCLKISNLAPGSVVLDPFMGSGTTVSVAKRLGFNAYGIERVDKVLWGARKRWKET